MAKDAEDLLGGHPEACTIAEIYAELAAAIGRAFPKARRLWVRGEVQQISDRTGNCYMDLVDPDGRRGSSTPVLKVRVWRTTWGTIRRSLAREGLIIEPGTVVVLRGRVEFYAPKGEVAFIVDELDVTALLGRRAAQRAALLRQLAAEGLLEANRRLPVPPVPLAVGLVASPGTEGYRDLLGQLESSGFAFSVRVAKALVQGPNAPRSLARAVARAGRSGADVVVVVRGGGSRADLVAFDSEPLARAIAGAPAPVWTGVGHTGDESVADLVANRHFITPTECGRELVARVSAWYEEQVVRPARVICGRAAHVLDRATERDAAARARVAAAARHQLERHGDRLVGRRGALAVLAPGALGGAETAARGRAALLGPAALRHLEAAGDRLVGWRRLTAAYDVERQLERGYTLTLDQAGRVLRHADEVAPGDTIVTRFADGLARSVVAAPDDGSAGGTG